MHSSTLRLVRRKVTPPPSEASRAVRHMVKVFNDYGITAFKEPRSKNAGITLIWMSLILGSLFLGISFIAKEIGVIPAESETVISQLASTVFAGRGTLYLMLIGATTVLPDYALPLCPHHDSQQKQSGSHRNY